MPQQPEKKRSTAELSAQEQSQVDAAIESALARGLAGDIAERNRLLDEAAAIAGTRNRTLNNLRGLVFEKGKWLTQDQLIAQSTGSGWLAKYHRKRNQSSDDLVGNLSLADWCAQSGLENEARAHWLRALDFDIDNLEVRSALGHVSVGNRWVTPEQIQALNEQANAAQRLLAQHADETKSILRKLESRSQKKRDEGLARLRQIDDPEWIVPLEVVFVSLNEEVAQVAIERLAYFDGRDATQALMRIAVYHPWPSIREQAARFLAGREQFDFVPELISLLATPVNSQFSVQRSRTGGLLYQHLFVQQTDEKNIVRESGVQIASSFDPRVVGQFQRTALARAEQMESMKEAYNRDVEQQNQVVIGALSRALNLDLGNDPTSWWNWWNEQNEVYVTSRPVSYQSDIQPLIVVDVVAIPASRYECLVAGTKVWTSLGLIPVERLTVGDRVLARNIESGDLSYQPVIRPTVRPPSPTVEIEIQGEVIQASGGHPFWVVGEGWVRARDLTAEMRLETVGGSTPVLSVRPGNTVELYNLVVDKDSNYFVGELGVWSHDNTIPSEGAKALRVRNSR